MWNLRLGWNWTETSQGKFFFEIKGHNIKEKELSRTHLDEFGRTDPWREFWRESHGDLLLHEGADRVVSFGGREPASEFGLKVAMS
jgi:hypothetical protein